MMEINCKIHGSPDYKPFCPECYIDLKAENEKLETTNYEKDQTILLQKGLIQVLEMNKKDTKKVSVPIELIDLIEEYGEIRFEDGQHVGMGQDSMGHPEKLLEKIKHFDTTKGA